MTVQIAMSAVSSKLSQRPSVGLLAILCGSAVIALLLAATKASDAQVVLMAMLAAVVGIRGIGSG